LQTVEEALLYRDWEDEDTQEGLIELALKEGDHPVDKDRLLYVSKKRKKPRIGESLEKS
jgi:hypothetical protein